MTRAAEAFGAKYRFGEFQLDTTELVLRQSGKILPLAPKAVQALELLIRNAGRVVSRTRTGRERERDNFY